MMTLDASYTIENDYSGNDLGKKAPVVMVYGTTMAGNSVLFHIHGFAPYFYVPAWDNFSQTDLRVFGESLNRELAESQSGKGMSRHVMKTEVVRKRSLWGYRFGKVSDFIKVTVAVPPLVATSRRLLEQGLHMGVLGRREFQTYESNLPYVLRFMVDKDMAGGSWIEAPKGKYNVRAGSKKTSHVQMELDMAADDLITHETEGEWAKIAPIRILSFDIECSGRKGFFPEAEKDPVIQIANIVKLYGMWMGATE